MVRVYPITHLIGGLGLKQASPESKLRRQGIVHAQGSCGGLYLPGTLSAWKEQGRPFASMPAMVLPVVVV